MGGSNQEGDSKDISNYARELLKYRKNGKVKEALRTLKVVRDMCDNSIRRIKVGGKRGERYFREIF